MSFTDMMSSGRGPGAIGMLMALVVLIGFGVLFMFAMDEGLQGGHQSIESVIRHQATEIEAIKNGTAAGLKLLENTPVRLKNSQELTRVGRENQGLRESSATLQNKIEIGKAEVARRNSAFEAYKDQYRDYIRGKAKGESMTTLETQNGVVYKNVNIREVTAVGIQIRHDDGQKRIPFEVLPVAMIERFQFDPKQKAAAVAKEQATWNEHEAAVSAADLVSGRQSAEQSKKDADALREKNNRLVAMKLARIGPLEEEIRILEDAIPKESEKRLSRAPLMRRQLANKQSELAALRAEVARTQANQ